MSQWYRSEERRKELKEERLKKEKAERAAGVEFKQRQSKSYSKSSKPSKSKKFTQKKGFIADQGGNRKGIVKGRKRDIPLHKFDTARDIRLTEIANQILMKQREDRKMNDNLDKNFGISGEHE